MSRKLLALLLVGALVLGVAGLAAADDEDGDESQDDRRGRDHGEDGERHGKPEHGLRGDKYLLKNDQIAVWFHAGKNHAKPDLRITFNGSDNETSGYRVKILRLYEAPADDPHFRGSYPKINLAKADDWNVRTEQTNESITLTMVRAEAQGIVTLVWHIDTVNATVKYDVQVDNWRWGNESHQLVLDMLIVGKNLKNATGANVTVEESGYITWETTARATYGANDTRNLTVESYRKVSDDKDEDEDDDREDRGAHILLVFNGTGGYDSLDYDPTFGVMSGSSELRDVPAAGLVAIAAVVGLAALGLRRRG